MGERLLCKQEVVGSIPSASTIILHASLRAAWSLRAALSVAFVL